MRKVFIGHLHGFILHEGVRCGRSGTVFLGHVPFQLIDLRLEHQDKSFMGCDYNIDEVFLTINGQRHYLWRAVGAP